MRPRLRLTAVLIVLVAAGVATWLSVASLAAPAGAPVPAGYFRPPVTIGGSGTGSTVVVVPKPSENLHNMGVNAVLTCNKPSTVTTKTCKTTAIMATVNATVTATPGNGSTFGSWTGCDTVVANVCTVTGASGEVVPIRATFIKIDTSAPPPVPPPPLRPPSVSECLGFEATILGTELSDTIVGTGKRDVIVSLGGNDDVRGLGGSDVICLGDGDDVAFGGSGGDYIFGGDGNDKIKAGAGRDRVFGEGGGDRIEGGPGRDFLFAYNDSAFNSNSLDVARNIVKGGLGRDDVRGAGGNDRLDGGAGNDELFGNAGDDRLSGGAGNDDLGGDEGDDRIFGGDGRDVLFGQGGADRLQGGRGNDSLFGDFLGTGGQGQRIDKLGGNGGDDCFDGGAGRDKINGGPGKDYARTVRDARKNVEVASKGVRCESVRPGGVAQEG